MHIVHVHIRVKSEFVDAFREATIENARNSVNEPGIARFDFVQSTSEPSEFVLVEVYRDQDAPAQHRTTTHYLRWRDTVTDMMAEPRTRSEYLNAFPPDSGW